MPLTQGYIAAALPARIVRVSNTTLFRVAQEAFGDALRWVEVAELNGLTDPWIVAETEIRIPPIIDTTVEATGILGL